MTFIRQQLASAVKWSTASQVIRVGGQVLSVVILARLLPSADFGLIAMASVVTGFVSLLRDFGSGAAVIQKHEPSPLLLDSVFWLNVFSGLALAALVGIASSVIAEAFGEPRLREVVLLLVLAVPVAGAGGLHQALLQKVSAFRQLALIEATATLGGLIAAVAAALSGWGVFSLVVQVLLSSLLTTVGLWVGSSWRPRMRCELAELRSVAKFSANLVGFSIFSYFSRNADKILIGRFLGAADLGFYAIAYRLGLWPVQNISSIANRVLFPAFSRFQADHAMLARGYTRATAIVTFLAAPLMFGFFVLNEPLVNLVLGPRWEPVSPLLFWLIPVGLLQAIGACIGTLYLSTGRTDVMFKWGIGEGIAFMAAVAIGLQWGVTGVAAAYAVLSAALFFPSHRRALGLVGIRVTDLLSNIAPSLLSASIMAGAVALSAAAWPADTNRQVFRLACLLAIGLMVYTAASLLSQRALIREIVKAGLNR